MMNFIFIQSVYTGFIQQQLRMSLLKSLTDTGRYSHTCIIISNIVKPAINELVFPIHVFQSRVLALSLGLHIHMYSCTMYKYSKTSLRVNLMNPLSQQKAWFHALLFV